MSASDYNLGFGLKCGGWMDLTADRFFDVISPFHREGSQCFRGARVGKPKDSNSSVNHSWVIIYGPKRGKLDMSMYRKRDYDVPVDPWPEAGMYISPEGLILY